MTWEPDPRIRHEIEETFRALRTRSTDSRYEFDGSKASVLYERLGLHGGTGWPDERTDVYRICKNAYGEYFLYMHAFQHEPYVIHLTRDRAMSALRIDDGAYQREFGE
jgi:hypothetical protein